MTGRVCLITGATSGIGRAAAVALARLGATAILVARERARGETALAAVRAASPTGSGDLVVADLSSQAEIRRLAGEVAARHPALHVLVNNAGAIYGRRETTADGIERTLATNHLAYFLLTALLLDRLRASAPARVVNVASDAHFGARLDFEHLQNRAISRVPRLQGEQARQHPVHPRAGAAARRERGHRELPAPRRRRHRLLAPRVRPLSPGVPPGHSVHAHPEQGADTIVYLASAPEVAEVSGEYFERRRIKRPSPAAEDTAAGRRLWEISAGLTGLAPARPPGA